ncbi:protein FAM111A-like [Archocentrus centrarchus]|uniref:protein FAM111A-like n=1 Tax=Archocentrus centrarchus TaxID=63155 RepID=UPI0011E9E444|nr:protein FAM111A-like [Archocentrus centrarchus]XP_030609859.1 protein FAM111A-like [Archocentrus centrarchus]
MPPKPMKKMPGGGSIMNFFSKQTGSPGGSRSRASMQPEGSAPSQGAMPTPVSVKEESDVDLTGRHSHEFTVKFNQASPNEYTVLCSQPCTVLKAIKSNEKCNEKIKCSDENIMIQLGKADKESSVATHFPCSCINDGECLIILCKEEKVEVKVQDFKIIHPKDHYSVFYIDTVGGLHTKRKELFKNSDVKKFKRVCVYGEKGMTVDEAVKRDGRFIDDLGYFELSDNRDLKRLTVHTQRVDNLHLRDYKMRLPKNIKENNEKQQESPSNNSQKKCKRRSRSEVLALAEQEGLSVKTAVRETDSGVDTDEIYERLREQFPDLKEWMENRFPGDSYQEALTLRKENFGKIQQAFSEVHRVRKLLELGKSVCKISVKDICVGTGFVLFDNLILTNAHLFKGYVEGKELQQDVEVFALFDYEEPLPKSNFYFFTAENRFIDFDAELDYAILELNPEGSKPNQQTKAKNIQVPPGLLNRFGPLPPNGEACIIGHPAGGVKKMDPTWIIETEKRGQAIDEHLRQYKDPFIITTISDWLKKQGIEDILIGGSKAEKVGTYHTFMYHGASGSPVFDGLGRVFGLHTAGYVCNSANGIESVIECAHPLLTIFENFVGNLKESENEELLKSIEEAAKRNPHLKEILHPEEAEEPMEVS